MILHVDSIKKTNKKLYFSSQTEKKLPRLFRFYNKAKPRELGGFLYLQTENYPHSMVELHLGGCAYAQPREWGGFLSLIN